MEALVRVAKQKSYIKFNNVKAYRALSLSDVPVMLSKIDSLAVLIFEDVQPDEIEGVRELANNFNGRVYTFGSIQLAGIKNFVCLSDLQDEILKEYRIEAKTYRSTRAPVLFPVVYTEFGEVYTGDKSLEVEQVLGIEDKSLDLDGPEDMIDLDGPEDMIDLDGPEDMIDLDGTEDIDFGGLVDGIDLGGLVQSATDEDTNSLELDSTDVISLAKGTVVEKSNSDVDEVESPVTLIDSEVATEGTVVEKVDTVTEEEAIVESEGTEEEAITDSIETEEEPVLETVDETTDSSVIDTISEPVEITKEAETSDKLVRVDLFGEELLDKGRLKEFNLSVKDESILLTVVSELNFYRDMLKKLDKASVTDSVMEIEGTYREQIGSLEREITNRSLELSNKQEEITSLLDSIDKLKAENDEKIKTLKKEGDARLQESISEHGTLLDKNKVLSSTLVAKEKELGVAQSKLKELAEIIESQNRSLQELRSSYVEQMGILGRVSIMYADLKETSETSGSQNEQLMELYKRVLADKSRLEEELTEMELKLKLSERKINEVNRGQEMKLADFEQTSVDLSEKLRVALADSQRLGLELEAIKEKEASVSRQKAQVMSQLDNVLAELENKEAFLVTKDALISDLESQLESFKGDSENASVYKEQAGIADLAASELQKQIGHLQMQTRELEIQMREKDRAIGSLNKVNGELRRSNDALGRSLKTGSKFTIKAHFSGTGFIIPVFGSGSYGTTTSAVSIANTLHAKGNNVLLMDLDLVSPKCHSYYKECSPLFTGDVGAITEVKRMYQSCMGVLTQRDTSHFIQEREKYIQTALLNKKTGKSLDLFTGLFGEIEMNKFSAINWDELLGVLGNDYDYLILDLGRLGGNDATDALIKMFTGMCLRCLSVTTKRDDDIRNMLVKITALKLNMKKLVWMLNLAEDTAVTKFVEKHLTGVDYRIVTMKSGLYGTTGLFTDSFFKGQFNAVVDLLTLETATKHSLDI